MKIYMRVI